jgi:cytochrome c-type biogenesis protein
MARIPRLDIAVESEPMQAFPPSSAAREMSGEMMGAMATNVNDLVAFGGGIVSFVSPCVLPVVPAYLSMVTGLDIAELERGRKRQLVHIARDTLLFIAGFGIVFVLLGVSATAIGSTLVRNHVLLTRISGGVVLAMAAFLAGSVVLNMPALYGEARFHINASRFGPFAAPLAGAAFGFGWTPCIGPVLSSVLVVALSDRGIGNGAVLLAFYALGLGVPFLIVGCGLGTAAGALKVVRRHLRAITLGSSALLACFGVLLVLNRLSWVTSVLESWMRDIGLGRLVNLG